MLGYFLFNIFLYVSQVALYSLLFIPSIDQVLYLVIKTNKVFVKFKLTLVLVGSIDLNILNSCGIQLGLANFLGYSFHVFIYRGTFSLRYHSCSILTIFLFLDVWVSIFYQ